MIVMADCVDLLVSIYKKGDSQEQASGGREAPKALRAFGHTIAQLRWAIVHKENKYYFLWPRGRVVQRLQRKNVRLRHYLKNTVL